MDIFLQVLYTVLVLGVLIFIHELGHFSTAKLFKIRVNEFALGMGPTLLKKQGKETLYSLKLFPIGGYCKMEGEDEESSDEHSINSKPVWMRIIVVVSGALMNLLLGIVITFIIVLSAEALPSQFVAQFDENSLSAQSGLQVGDKIIKIDDKNVNIYTDIAAGLSEAYNRDSVDMVVERNGERVVLNDVKFPKEQVGKELYSMVPDFYVNPEAKSFVNIMKHTLFRTLSFVTVMYETLGDLVTGKASVEYLSGPVGTSTVIASAAKSGFMTLISLVALISINLCVVNLLPLPALDGGRLVFMLIELIRGKPVNQKYEAVVHFVGLLLLFALMILITFKDIFYPVV